MALVDAVTKYKTDPAAAQRLLGTLVDHKALEFAESVDGLMF